MNYIYQKPNRSPAKITCWKLQNGLKIRNNDNWILNGENLTKVYNLKISRDIIYEFIDGKFNMVS